MSLFSLAFDTGNRRQLSGLPGHVTKALGATISVWVLYSATLSRLDVLSIIISFYSTMLALSFLYIAPTSAPETTPRRSDWLLSGISLIVGCDNRVGGKYRTCKRRSQGHEAIVSRPHGWLKSHIISSAGQGGI